MNFSDALDFARNGKRIARAGWNGKGMFVFYVTGGYMTVNFTDGNPEERRLLPHLIMSTVTGDLVPWLCSQTDMLAEDWGVV